MQTFNLTQSKEQVQAILNKMEPFANTGNAGVFGFGYAQCNTAGATAAKVVSIENFILCPGGIISVNFVNAFTASNPTLSVNGSAAKPIKLYENAMPMGKVHANTILVMFYDGRQFNVIAIESQRAAAPTGFVDLALPSGLLWCEHNVGASTPYEDGLYFSWGNVTGHTGDDGYDFGETNDGPYAQTPGAALTGNIPTNGTYDASRHNMGSPCRMPTLGEFQELNNNCDSEWTDENGVTGRRFTSRINGNSIFFPASGNRYGTGLRSRGLLGVYWSASLHSAALGYYLYFDSSGVNPAGSSLRFNGFSVRAVQ